jgi:tetratricopeptide (TPR) repeat protein
MEAYAEAAQLAEQALSALAAARDRPAQTDVELHALLLAAYAHVALGGYFNPAAQALYERARELVQRREADPREMLGVLRGHWLGASSRACYREARALAGEMIGIADRAGLVAFRGIGRYLAGNAALWLAQFRDAVALLEEALAILGAQTDVDALIAHDQNFEATATGYLGWGYWYLGDADRALELGERAMELARRRGHVLTLLHTMMTYCSIAMGSVMTEKVSARADEMIHLAQSRELAMWADMGRLLQHWSHAHCGYATDAAAAARTLDRLCTMYPGGAAGFQVIFADACLVNEERARARDTLAALEISLQATEARIFAATRHILAGELARQERHVADAAARFQRAIEIAAAQGSPMLEARARAALCKTLPAGAGAAHAGTMLGAAGASGSQRKLAH